MNPRKCLFSLFTFIVFAATSAIAQKPSDIDLDHFDLKSVDKSIDPCSDFYQYSCKKWLDSNPIPGDQPAWSHGSKLGLWNQNVLREVLDKSSADDPKRSACAPSPSIPSMRRGS